MKGDKHRNNKNKDSAPLTILIIEDDEDLNRFIQKFLQKSGFRTETALNGIDAIVKVVEDTNKLLLLDYILPDMTGEKVIRSLTDKAMSVPF
ncbi:MAG: response regulator [Candidatus Hatepunaea meridiana]|nr:response regulator [Candidatus Hatepunaea meridiana]